MERDSLVWEYMHSRVWYLESELKRASASLDEIKGYGDPKCYAHSIGLLEGKIDSYVDELEALDRFMHRLHDIASAENGWYQGRWEGCEEE